MLPSRHAPLFPSPRKHIKIGCESIFSKCSTNNVLFKFGNTLVIKMEKSIVVNQKLMCFFCRTFQWSFEEIISSLGKDEITASQVFVVIHWLNKNSYFEK
jgi:hypothetical protein